MIHVIATVRLKPGCRDKYLEILKGNVSAVKGEAGCLVYAPTIDMETDIEIHARDLLRMRDRIEDILSYHCGKSKEVIHSDTERDKILSAEDAVKYGLADQVMNRRQV